MNYWGIIIIILLLIICIEKKKNVSEYFKSSRELSPVDKKYYNVVSGFDDKKIAAALLKFTGKITQQLPKFSAKRIDGKSYFDKAKQQVAFTPESKEIQIHQLKLIGSDTIGKQQLQKKLQKINLVKGDFRQAEIHNNWQKIISQLPEKLIISKFTANTSKRAYIRSLVRDISQSLNIPATTYSLTRTANGKFAIKDCVCLM